MRFSTLRTSLALALTLSTLVGCGRLAPLATGLPLGNVGVLADFADIAQQIERNKVAVDENGIRVSKLPTPGKAKPATFLTYKALDNNLSSLLPQHINTLERAGSSTGVNVVAMTDGEAKGDTREYYIRQDRDEKTITSPYIGIGRGGELDTGSPASLKRAVKWAHGSYPSSFRWVDVNNHGGGYYGIAQDEQSTNIIRLPQLADALGSAGKVDLLTFDACLMATTEVAYELRNVAKVMVGSEDDTLALSMNYDQTLAALATKSANDPAALARDLVLRAARKGTDVIGSENGSRKKKTSTEMGIYTISAIDLSKAERVKGAVDQLAGALLTALPRHKGAIVTSLGAVKGWYVSGPSSDWNHRDLHEVVTQLRQRVQDPGVQAACAAVQDTLFNKNGAIIMSRAARQEQKIPRGLSIYLPLNGQVDAIYRDTAFAKATRWDEFLAALAP